MDRPLRVCYFGTYRERYARNQIMIAGLRQAGVEVVECHAPLWEGIEDRVRAASGAWLRPAFIVRLVRAYGQLFRRHWTVGNYDILIAAYPGQFDVYLARLLAWWRRKPLVWDALLSTYMMVTERKLSERSRLTTALLRWSEWLTCRLPERIILQTRANTAWYQVTYGLAPERVRLVSVAADDRVFRPIEASESSEAGIFRVIYHGTFIANHGVEYIVEAARLLAAEPKIQFELIGSGPEQAAACQLAQHYKLANIVFVDWLDKLALLHRLAQADLCLGIFGDTLQSQQTLHNKVFEGLAMARPVVTGDAPAIREVLTHGEHVYLCERANPQALAQAILALRDNRPLRETLARNGHAYYCQHFTVEQVGLLFKQHLLELVA